MVNVPLAGEKPGSDSLPRCPASVRNQGSGIDPVTHGADQAAATASSCSAHELTEPTRATRPQVVVSTESRSASTPGTLAASRRAAGRRGDFGGQCGTERAAAAETVAGLTGVRNVWNDIEIIYDIDPVDADLHVQEVLDRSALVPDGSDVKADTKDNVITLTGHVRTWAEHDAVLGAAWMASGVIGVRDGLEVTG